MGQDGFDGLLLEVRRETVLAEDALVDEYVVAGHADSECARKRRLHGVYAAVIARVIIEYFVVEAI